MQPFTVLQTSVFDQWFGGLRDERVRLKIATRLDRLRAGHFGDSKFFKGIGELRVDTGPGFRLYFVRRGNTVIVLLCAGDKSTQRRDIERALDMASEVEQWL